MADFTVTDERRDGDDDAYGCGARSTTPAGPDSPAW